MKRRARRKSTRRGAASRSRSVVYRKTRGGMRRRTSKGQSLSRKSRKYNRTIRPRRKKRGGAGEIREMDKMNMVDVYEEALGEGIRKEVSKRTGGGPEHAGVPSQLAFSNEKFRMQKQGVGWFDSVWGTGWDTRDFKVNEVRSPLWNLLAYTKSGSRGNTFTFDTSAQDPNNNCTNSIRLTLSEARASPPFSSETMHLNLRPDPKGSREGFDRFREWLRYRVGGMNPDECVHQA